MLRLTGELICSAILSYSSFRSRYRYDGLYNIINVSNITRLKATFLKDIPEMGGNATTVRIGRLSI